MKELSKYQKFMDDMNRLFPLKTDNYIPPTFISKSLFDKAVDEGEIDVTDFEIEKFGLKVYRTKTKPIIRVCVHPMMKEI